MTLQLADALSALSIRGNLVSHHLRWNRTFSRDLRPHETPARLQARTPNLFQTAAHFLPKVLWHVAEYAFRLVWRSPARAALV
jgi:hypothetical protein